MPNWRRLSKLGSKCSAETGTAAIEFGIFGPLFVILIVATAEIGFTMHGAMKVHHAVEAGLVYVAKYGEDTDGIKYAVTNSSAYMDVEASPAPTQFCGCPLASGIQTVSCNVKCGNGDKAGEYIRIDASLDRTSIFPNSGFVLPTKLTASAILRQN